MGNYHNRIMTLKPVRSMSMFVDKQAYDHYYEGYARALKHASEIALEAEREIEELKERNIKLYDQLGEAYKEIMILENDLQEFIENQPPL